MLIRHFIPLAVVVIALLSAGADKVGVPPAPIAVIATVAAIMLAMQVEDQKLGDFVRGLLRAFKDQHHA